MKLSSIVLAVSFLVVAGCDAKPEAVPGLTNELRAPTAGRGGIPDDSIKPVAKTGIPDDSVKPVAKTGVPDDSVKPRPVAPKPVTLPAPAPLPTPVR